MSGGGPADGLGGRLARSLDYRLRRRRIRASGAAARRQARAERGDRRTVWVHVGVHKTGSSAIQTLLRTQADVLADQGLHVDRGAIALSARLLDGSPLSPDTLDSARRELAAVHAPHAGEIVVMSGEGFSGDAWTGYANADAVVGDLRALLDGADVRVVVAVRRQDTFVESLYHQHVKQGGTQTFEEFVAALPPGCLDWERMTGILASAFGREHLRVLTYEGLFDPPETVLERVFGGLGQDFETLATGAPVRNPSLSPTGLRIATACNPFLEPDERKTMRAFLAREFAKAPGAPFGLLDDLAREAFVAPYRESNGRLFDAYLPDSAQRAYYVSDA